MPSKSIHSLLRETFPPSKKEIWKKISSHEIEGRDAMEILSWKSEDDLKYFPYYDKSDTAHLNYLDDFSLTVAEDEYFGPRKWLNAPHVSVLNANSSNAIAIQHLANGADAIFFQVPPDIALEDLMSGIEWQYCSLYFMTNDPTFLSKAANWIANNNLDPKKIMGARFWDNDPRFEQPTMPFDNFRVNGIYVSTSTSAAEIADAITKGVRLLQSAPEINESVFKSVSFSMPVNAKLLESAAKLKALRMLWFQVAQAYGLQNFTPADLHIHARSQQTINPIFEPHGNMLYSTVAALSAVIGGADVITISAEREENKTLNRIARNIQSILREESHLDRVADPLNGAYAFQNMVDAIAKKAWQLFQSKIRS